MALSPEILLSMALQNWLWSRDSVRKFRKSSLKNKSYTADSGKAMADVVESVPTSETMSIARSMPSHVPLRYAQMYPEMILTDGCLPKEVDESACALC